jgi:hypothetical protein
MSLDISDFIDHPMGGSNSNSFRTDAAQGSPFTTYKLDGELSSVESIATRDPATYESQMTHLRRGIVSGL